MKKAIFGLLAVLVAGMAAASGVYAHGLGAGEDAKAAIEAGDYEAFRAAMANSVSEERFQEMAGYHQQMAAAVAALEEGDYQAWLEAQQGLDMPHASVITEENFLQFAEMHNAMQSGDFESAKQMAADLGLEGFGMMGPGMHGKGFRGMGTGCPLHE